MPISEYEGEIPFPFKELSALIGPPDNGVASE
jgi:hypothetical protein